MSSTKVLRVFADHYQFFVYGQGINPFDPLPEYTDESASRGWTRTKHAISFSTHAHLNDHRLDVFLSPPPNSLDADRATIHSLDLPTGCLALYDTEESVLAELDPGEYALVLCAYNLGEERDYSGDSPSDEQLFSHLEWERYELYVFKPTRPVTDGPYQRG